MINDLLFSIPVYLILLLPSNTIFLTSTETITACESFATGEIDAYKTLEALNLDLGDYSIGVINTAKIFCA